MSSQADRALQIANFNMPPMQSGCEVLTKQDAVRLNCGAALSKGLPVGATIQTASTLTLEGSFSMCPVVSGIPNKVHKTAPSTGAR